MIPTLMSWSGGKDSCMALHALQQSGTHRVTGLFTTVTREDDRIGMHGVHRELIARQAAALRLPIDQVPIPAGAINTVYEAAVAEALARHRADGIDTVAFGDLFLADIRRYREHMMARIHMRPIFPVWGRDTRAFVDDFVASGFRAVVVSVDLAVLDETFAGRMIDAEFVADLPPGVDPCGENGEFHSFVFDGPNFASAVAITIEDTSSRGGLCYCEISGNR